MNWAGVRHAGDAWMSARTPGREAFGRAGTPGASPRGTAWPGGGPGVWDSYRRGRAVVSGEWPRCRSVVAAAGGAGRGTAGRYRERGGAFEATSTAAFVRQALPAASRPLPHRRPAAVLRLARGGCMRRAGAS